MQIVGNSSDRLGEPVEIGLQLVNSFQAAIKVLLTLKRLAIPLVKTEP